MRTVNHVEALSEALNVIELRVPTSLKMRVSINDTLEEVVSQQSMGFTLEFSRGDASCRLEVNFRPNFETGKFESRVFVSFPGGNLDPIQATQALDLYTDVNGLASAVYLHFQVITVPLTV